MKTQSVRRFSVFALALFAGVATSTAARAAAADPAIIKSEFIADNPPFATSHASTLVETTEGLQAAWFGGTREGAPDVSIWLARNDGAGWSAPVEVASGNDAKHGVRYPCWNPVLFRRHNGDLLLFYKVGPSPASWWGMVRVSTDNGKSWSEVKRLPHGYVGPVRNKPVELGTDLLLCGSSLENKGWRVHMEMCHNPLGSWDRTPDLNAAYTYAAIQPTILRHSENLIQILCRTKQGCITECWSTNGAASWGPMRRTSLPNPNSAIDSVVLRDGRFLLVYNPSRTDRGVLAVAVSDDGKVWQAGPELENQPGDEYSYPAVIQTADGLVHITYTWKRQRIKHVVLDVTKFNLHPLPGVN
jgi:predicted neuraminidase